MEPKSPKKIRFNYARIITAFLIVVAVLGAIALGNTYVAIMFLIVNVLGARELCYVLEEEKTPVLNVVYMLLGILPFVLMYVFSMDFGSLYLTLIGISMGFMLGLILNLWMKNLKYSKVRYPFALLYWGLPFSLAAYFLIFSGVDIRHMMFGVITLIWTSDTMAYLTGKAIGKNKLFPSVSPGKTWEGSLGAGFFSVIVSLGFAYAFNEPYLKWIALALFLWVFGTLGDLVESRMKRVQDVKDSGSILPGHGGLLDRFDSLVLLIPFLLLLEYYFRS